VVAAIYGKRAMWGVPAIFVTGMAVGGTVGMVGVYMPYWVFEAGIAGSVLLLGLALALKRTDLLRPSLVAVAIFGFFHGYAHGAEMPALASPLLFAAGFLLGTTGLHLAGVGLGAGALRLDTRVRAIRVAGACLAAFGLWLCIGLI
jgi:urease accessory protein